MPTPGAPPAWCFEPRGNVELSVTVDGGSIRLHQLDTDEDVTFASTPAMVEWLQEERPGALLEPKGRLADRLKRDRLFRWD